MKFLLASSFVYLNQAGGPWGFIFCFSGRNKCFTWSYYLFQILGNWHQNFSTMQLPSKPIGAQPYIEYNILYIVYYHITRLFKANNSNITFHLIFLKSLEWVIRVYLRYKREINRQLFQTPAILLQLCNYFLKNNPVSSLSEVQSIPANSGYRNQ